ncbi:arsenic resistance protein [Salinilacihabitans rarus]|uniref:arsenic resistance protein n=1 Tax=Salinilacihabitans rarus TaxID=2961596 RepID=UPI0020C8E4C0|nr:bile acid:sodium symporter [Salinilacihabitans rarus]
MISDFLESIKANLVPAVVLSLALGLVSGQFIGPGVAGVLQSAVVPILFLMVYPMMVTLDLRELLKVRRHAGLVGATLLVNFGLAPLAAVGLARLFFAGDPHYAVGLYFIALIPTSGMTAAWTGLAGGDLEGALVAMSVNLLAAVVLLPVYLSALVGADVGFEPTALYRQLALIVVLPMIAGAVTRRGLLRRYGADDFRRLKPTLGGLSSAGVVLIVFVAMAMRSESILADPVASLVVVVPLVAFYAAVLGIGTVVGSLLFDSSRTVALVYATSMRNLSIALAIAAAPGFPPAEAVLPIALAYLLQPPLGAAYAQYRRTVVDEEGSLRDVIPALG